MIMKRKLFFVTMLLVSGLVSSAQRFSNKGRDFWVGYGLHLEMENDGDKQQMVIYLGAEAQDANVTITTYGERRELDGTYTKVVDSRPYFVPKYSVIQSGYMPKQRSLDCRLYDVPVAYGGRGSDRLFDRSIHIESDVPIVAYGHISDEGSSGATMLMPVESWGYSYMALNIEQKIIGSAGPGLDCSSWLFVVANHDDTKVEITPSVPLRNGAEADKPFTVTMQKGQIYQVVAARINETTGYELTGTRVRSVGNSADDAFPIAVFTGSSATAITCNNTTQGYADNIIQQIVPLHAWGRSYLTAPFSSSNAANELNPTIYRVAVKDPTTVVKKNGQVLTGLKKGYYYEYVSPTADYIEADKPVLMGQYIPSMGTDPGCGYKGMGDPEMVYISPIEQAINHLGFYRNTDVKVVVNYLTLIVPDQGLASLKIDGQNNFSYTYPHPNRPGYTVVVKEWKPAKKAQCIVDCDSSFTSITYGLGSYDSYAYNGGSMVNNLNGTLSLHNVEGKPGVEHKFTCTSSPVEISMLMTYQPTKLVWHMSELTKMSPNADITQDNPVSVGTVMVKGIPYYKYTVPGTYTFSETGTFRFTVTSTHPAIENYGNRENLLLDIDVKDVNFTAAFTHAFTGCISDAVVFNWDPTPAAGKYVVDRWKWTFPEGAEGTTKTESRTFTTNSDKDITLRVITEEGCIGSNTKTISLKFPVKMQIKASKIDICSEEPVDFEAVVNTPAATPVNAWYWSFGNGTTSTLEKPKAILFKEPGSYTVKLVGKAGGGACIADTVTLTIKVNAKPYTSFSYPAGCLPTDGIVKFVSKASASDGSLITVHTWNFGDPASNAANTSTLADPAHKYSFGDYTITYAVTTEHGCRKDTSVNATFSVKPVMSFPSLTGACENVPAFSIAKAVVQNGVPGTGVYKGKGTDGAGSFNPATAGPGTHEIKYVFTTTGGCIDSISSNIEVWAAPVASFDITSNACLGKDVTITDKSPVTTPAVTSWKWDLGDNTAVTYNNGNPFTKRYATANSYTVALTLTDTRGCVSSIAQQSTVVHPLPVPAFTIPAAICLPGTALFTNQSATPDNSSLQYKWNMGDASTVITSKDANHEYKSAGTYTISLEATTAFGCVATKSSQVSGFRNRPDAKFSVSPQAVCQGKEQNFSDNSTTSNGTITAWKWDFADGATAIQKNFVKQYARAGTYQVTLTVTDAAGCTAQSGSQPVTIWVQPVINAGEPVSAMKGSTVTLKATANKPEALKFVWTPDAGMSNAHTLQPTFTALQDQVFTLTATSLAGNCSASDQVSVKVLTAVIPPSAFSPNADGVHDTWVVEGLADYLQSTVQVFNRYGQLVFSSKGYPAPWDGKMAGKELPSGTYYYIITDKTSTWQRMSGPVTIIR